jgi:DNA-directed RNA polymerase specialized sigma24 family protein
MNQMPTTVEDGPATLSPPEVVRAIKSLTDGEKTALIKAARLYARKTPYDHEDLVQEALTRVLDHRRLWPVGVSATLFLGGVIRSIAWEWKHELRGEETDVGDEGVQERGTIARIDIGKIIALFNDDPVAQKIVMGMMDGARGEELQETSGLDQIEYESKRKKIRRRIEKLMP